MSVQPPTFGVDEFRKASKSEPHRECVCVARRDGWVEIRDDKTDFGSPADHRLRLTDSEFDTALARIRAGESTQGTYLDISATKDGTFVMRSAQNQGRAQLRFTKAEIDAFYDGVHKGEFAPVVADR